MCLKCQIRTRKDIDNLYADFGIQDQQHFIIKFNNICTHTEKAKAFVVTALTHYLASRQVGYVSTQFDLAKIKAFINEIGSFDPYIESGHSVATQVFNPDQVNTLRFPQTYFELLNEYEDCYHPRFFGKIHNFVDFTTWYNSEGKNIPDQIEYYLQDRLGYKFPENNSVKGLRFKDNFKSILFNLLKEFYLTGDHEFYILIDHDFNWKDGDFGDKDSCIFSEDGCNRYHLDWIKSSCMAIKIYVMADGIPVKSVARALLGYDLYQKRIVLFNGYGKAPFCGTSRDNSIISMFSNILAKQYNLTYLHYQIESSIYINLDKGFIFAKPDEKIEKDYHHITVFPNEGFFVCHHCEDVHSISEIKKVEGNNWCTHCYVCYFFTCESCGKEDSNNNSCNYYTINNRQRIRHYLCADCFSAKIPDLKTCYYCERSYIKEDIIRMNNSRYACKICHTWEIE